MNNVSNYIEKFCRESIFNINPVWWSKYGRTDIRNQNNIKHIVDSYFFNKQTENIRYSISLNKLSFMSNYVEQTIYQMMDKILYRLVNETLISDNIIPITYKDNSMLINLKLKDDFLWNIFDTDGFKKKYTIYYTFKEENRTHYIGTKNLLYQRKPILCFYNFSETSNSTYTLELLFYFENNINHYYMCDTEQDVLIYKRNKKLEKINNMLKP